MDNPTETTLKLSGGQEYRVLFSYLGMMRAEEEYGYDVSGVEMDPNKKAGMLRTMLTEVWLGILTYELIALEELAAQVRTQDDMQAVAKCYSHVQKYQAPKGGEGSKKKSPLKT